MDRSGLERLADDAGVEPDEAAGLPVRARADRAARAGPAAATLPWSEEDSFQPSIVPSLNPTRPPTLANWHELVSEQSPPFWLMMLAVEVTLPLALELG